ncbi:MAG: hypothetical protein ACI4XH_06035 [Acutalibacteraceae bacterium]
MNEDTVKLLRECSSGAKMGVDSIEEIMPHVKNSVLAQSLSTCRDEHEKIGAKVDGMLTALGEEAKSPNVMAKGMSWVKTNFKLSLTPDDSTAAGLVTDGCNMGIKSLTRYLNEYTAAQESAKDIAKELIKSEDICTQNIREFL